LAGRLRGSGPQRRGPCPLHRGDARGRTFSVNLDANVFQCFAKECRQKGDVIDLWAALHGQSLRAAALELVRTFGAEPAPPPGTGKGNGWARLTPPAPRIRPRAEPVRDARGGSEPSRSYRPSSPRRGLTFAVTSVARGSARILTVSLFPAPPDSTAGRSY